MFASLRWINPLYLDWSQSVKHPPTLAYSHVWQPKLTTKKSLTCVSLKIERSFLTVEMVIGKRVSPPGQFNNCSGALDDITWSSADWDCPHLMGLQMYKYRILGVFLYLLYIKWVPLIWKQPKNYVLLCSSCHSFPIHAVFNVTVIYFAVVCS